MSTCAGSAPSAASGVSPGADGAALVEAVAGDAVVVDLGERQRRRVVGAHDAVERHAVVGEQRLEPLAEAVARKAAEVGDRLLEPADRARGVERPAARMAVQVVGRALEDEVVERLTADQDHGASSPLPRSISVVGTTTRTRRAVVAVEPREQPLGGQPAELVGVLGDDRQARARRASASVRSSNPTSATARCRSSARRRCDGADRDQVLGGEQRGRGIVGASRSAVACGRRRRCRAAPSARARRRRRSRAGRARRGSRAGARSP